MSPDDVASTARGEQACRGTIDRSHPPVRLPNHAAGAARGGSRKRSALSSGEVRVSAEQSLEVGPVDAISRRNGGAEQVAEMVDRGLNGRLPGQVLIVEDEPLIAMDLERAVLDAGLCVLAIARTANEAISLVRKRSPDLVLSDIHLADGSSGLMAAREIMQISNAPIIFITAYPERLLTAERPDPTLMITKPFSPEQVRAIINQALRLLAGRDRSSTARDGATS